MTKDEWYNLCTRDLSPGWMKTHEMTVREETYMNQQGYHPGARVLTSTGTFKFSSQIDKLGGYGG